MTEGMDERERRLGLNEALFREVNESIKDVNRALDTTASDLDIVCECGDEGCSDRIRVPFAVYERVRSDSKQFLLELGHDDPTVERVIEHLEGYVIVEKEGVDVEQVAEETDPRS